MVDEFYYLCITIRNKVIIGRLNLFSSNLKKEINSKPIRDLGNPVN